MIHKMDSHELNGIMAAAQEQVSKAQNQVKRIQDVVQNKLELIDIELAYQNYCLSKLEAKPVEKKYIANLFDTPYGLFEKYFFDVHGKFVKDPVNVFNLFMPGTNPVYFREDATLYFYGDEDQGEDITDTLKHDSLQTTYFFKKIRNPRVRLSLALKDFQLRLGPTRFNVIELDAFLSGASQIQEITIYKLSETLQDDLEPTRITSFGKLGSNRIVLDQKYQFYRIDIDMVLNYNIKENGQTYYPFGLRHIYLLDADFDTNSHAIVEVKAPSTLAFVKDDCTLYSNRGITKTTLSQEDIKLYLSYQNNTLSLPFNPSTSVYIDYIPTFTDTFYAYIPLGQIDCLSSIGFEAEMVISDES